MPPVFHPITGEKLPDGYALAEVTNRYDYTYYQDIHWSIYMPKRTASAASTYAAENNYTEALRTSFPRDTEFIQRARDMPQKIMIPSDQMGKAIVTRKGSSFTLSLYCVQRRLGLLAVGVRLRLRLYSPFDIKPPCPIR